MEGPRPEGTETLMATPSVTPKADLGSLRIHDGERKSRGMGRRITIAAIPVVIFAGIVAAAFAFRSQKPMVEVVSAAKPDAGGPQTLLNASGYITPRRRATIAAKITGRVTGVFFDEGTRAGRHRRLRSPASQRQHPTQARPGLAVRRSADAGSIRQRAHRR